MKTFKDMHDAAEYMKKIMHKNTMDYFYGSHSIIRKDDLSLIGDNDGRTITIKFDYIGYTPYKTPEYVWIENKEVFRNAIRKLKKDSRQDLAQKLQYRYKKGTFTAQPNEDEWEIAFALVYCGAVHYTMTTPEGPGESIEVNAKSYVISEYLHRMSNFKH